MTGKDYLAQYKQIAIQLDSIEERIQSIKTELTAIDVGSIRSPWPDGQPHGTGTTDPTGVEAVKAADAMSERYREKLRTQLLDYEVEAYKTRSELWSKRIEIEETIGAVTNPVYSEILQRHYIGGQIFELIAVEMHYSYRHVIRLHRRACSAVEAVLRNGAKMN